MKIDTVGLREKLEKAEVALPLTGVGGVVLCDYQPACMTADGPEPDEGHRLFETEEPLARLIVAAVNALPSLLDELDALRARAERGEYEASQRAHGEAMLLEQFNEMKDRAEKAESELESLRARVKEQDTLVAENAELRRLCEAMVDNVAAITVDPEARGDERPPTFIVPDIGAVHMQPVEALRSFLARTKPGSQE